MTSKTNYVSRKGALLRRVALAGTALSFVALAPAFAAPNASQLPNSTGWTGSGTGDVSTASITVTGGNGVASVTLADGTNDNNGSADNLVVSTGAAANAGLVIGSASKLNIIGQNQRKETNTNPVTYSSTAPVINTLIIDNSGAASDIEGGLTYTTQAVATGQATVAGTGSLFIANSNGIIVGSGATITAPGSIYLEGYNASNIVTAGNALNYAGTPGNGAITIAKGATLTTGTGGSVIVAGAGAINISQPVLGAGVSLTVDSGLNDAGAAFATPVIGAGVTLAGVAVAPTTAPTVYVYGTGPISISSAVAPTGDINGTVNLYSGYTGAAGTATAMTTLTAAQIAAQPVTVNGTVGAPLAKTGANLSFADFMVAGNATSSGSVAIAGSTNYDPTVAGTLENTAGGLLTLSSAKDNSVTVGTLQNDAVGAILFSSTGTLTAALTLTGPVKNTGVKVNNSGVFDVQSTTTGTNKSDNLVVNGSFTNNSGAILQGVASTYSLNNGISIPNTSSTDGVLTPVVSPGPGSTANADSGLTVTLDGAAQDTQVLTDNFINNGTINVLGWGTASVPPTLQIQASNIQLNGAILANGLPTGRTVTPATSISAAVVNAINPLASLVLVATNNVKTPVYTGATANSVGAIKGTGVNAGVIDYNTNVTVANPTATTQGFQITAGAVRFLSGSSLVDAGTAATSIPDTIITGSNNGLNDPFTNTALNYALSVFPNAVINAVANQMLIDTQVNYNAGATIAQGGTTTTAAALTYTYGDINDVGTLGSSGNDLTIVANNIHATNSSTWAQGLVVGDGKTLTIDFAGNVNNPNGPAMASGSWQYNYMPVTIAGAKQGETGSITAVLNSYGSAGWNNLTYGALSGTPPAYVGNANDTLSAAFGGYSAGSNILAPGGVQSSTPQLVNLMVNGNVTFSTGSNQVAPTVNKTTDKAYTVTNVYNDYGAGSATSLALNNHLVVQATGNITVGGATNTFGAKASTTFWPGLVYLRNVTANGGAGVMTISSNGSVTLNSNLQTAASATLASAGNASGITLATNALNLNSNLLALGVGDSLTFSSSAVSQATQLYNGESVLGSTLDSTSTAATTVLDYSQLAASGYLVNSSL